ncbi:phosphoglycerate mutase family protein [Trichoderma pleuroticola]
MEPLIFVVRHAEAEHNVIMDFSQRDPPLTLKGFDQASHLAKTFPESSSISVVLTSPLKRALQTTIKGFSHVLALSSVGEDDQNGTARLLVDRDLQETSDLPCDTGSDRDVLETLFPNVDFTMLDKDWFIKTGMFAADEEAVVFRARAFRKKLWNIAKSVRSDTSSSSSQRAIVVVTHSAFMQYLSQDMNLNLPQAGWNSFRIQERPDGEIVLLST